MKNLRRFFEYGYLVIGIILLVDGIYRFNQPGERNNSYFLLAFAVLAVFMYFFKRHFRKKIESGHYQKKKDE
ncbi:hypothetical protein UMM65_05950 [Aureibaculum sp. 2210JD6-5]|uniref:hypothetical protein n=1 Tax=Aureibaculum sp. 2210JD6-5 TaxID=3103957 RepID=UPI002AADC9E8|nr:hypothetical protein [Aureibaculum sp. 2210JD6-5]MDY7394776.1 hypothetical protein [Aureibaculum sp. 2210JD6-5]